MSLFNKIKDKIDQKLHEVNVCSCCGKEYEGIMQGVKLDDGNFVCSECFPHETKLMKEKYVVRKDFDRFKLDINGVNKYREYREKEKVRQEKFEATDTFLKDKVLFDKNNMWFKLADFDEIFYTQQISSINAGMIKNDNKYDVVVQIVLDNWIYANLIVEFKHKGSFIASSKKIEEEIKDILKTFHREVRPDIEFVCEFRKAR